MRSIRNLGLIVALACLWAAPGASAATQIGKVFPNTASCTNSVFAQVSTAAPQPSYAVPAGGGVITSWSHQARADPSQSAALLAMRAAGGNDFLVAGSSGAKPLAASSLNTFAARIPAQAGDVLGLWIGAAPVACAQGGLPAGNPVMSLGSIATEPAAGLTLTLAPTVSGVLDVSALVELDADKDGFGDETQDQCPTDASTQGACPVAAATATDKVAPKVSTLRALSGQDVFSQRSIVLVVVADEAGTASATGSLDVPKVRAAKAFALTPDSTAVAANGRALLELKASKKALRAARKALKKRKRVRANIALTLKDAAGNATATKAAIPVKLPRR